MTTLEAQPALDIAAMQTRLGGRMAVLRSRVRRQLALEGLARAAVALVAMLIVAFALDWLVEPSLPARVVMLLIIAGVLGVIIRRDLVGPLRGALAPITLAAALDEAAGDHLLAARVATVLELPGVDGFSAPMIEDAVRRSFTALDAVGFERRTNVRHLRASSLALAGALIVPVVVALLMPGATSLWTRRWFTGSNELWPRYTTLVLDAPVGQAVPRGEPLTLRVKVTDQKAPTQKVWMRFTVEGGSSQTVALTRFGPGDFRHDLPPVERPITLVLTGGDARLGPVTIHPVDRPRLTDVIVVARHPRTAEPVTQKLIGGEGDVSLLPKTEVQLTIVANTPLASITPAPGSDAPGTFQRVDDRTFTIAWTHEQPVQMKLELVSAEASLASHPVPLAIGLRPDRPPTVSLRHTGVRQRITAVATIPLAATARDDIGLTSVSIAGRYDRPSAEGEKPVMHDVTPANIFGPAKPATDTSAEPAHAFAVEPLKLNVGDLLTLSAKAVDDCYTGPQTGESRPITFRIVTPEELFREILLRQQGLRAKLRKTTTDAETLRDAIASAALPDKAAELLRAYRLIQREVWSVGQALADSSEEMRLNRLGGDETYQLSQKYIVGPIKRLHDGPMNRQREALESLGTARPDPVADVVTRQEEIVADLNAILAQMAQWDSFIDVVNQLNEIIRLQEKLKAGTEKLQQNRQKSIFDP